MNQNNKDQKNKDAATILSARIHEYQKPLSIDYIAKPTISAGEQVLLKVAAAGLCHSDLHLINGDWKDIIVQTYRFLLNVKDYQKCGIKPNELAALTDAGLTPYRAIKKIRHLLEPGTNIAIVGVGGLGSYAIQYAKIFGAGSNVLAIDV